MLKQARHRGQQAVILSQVLASNVTLGAEDIVDCALRGGESERKGEKGEREREKSRRGVFFTFFHLIFSLTHTLFFTHTQQAKSTASTGSRSTRCGRWCAC